jgi:hypothetical protein
LLYRLLNVSRLSMWENLGSVSLMSDPLSVPFGNLRIVANANRFMIDFVLFHQIVPRFILRYGKNLKFVGIKVLSENLLEVVLTVWKLLLVYSCAPLANEDTEIDYHI